MEWGSWGYGLSEKIRHGCNLFLYFERSSKLNYLKTKKASWLKHLSAKFKLQNEDKKIIDMKFYVEELQEHLKTVVKTRHRIKERVFATKKLASNYAKYEFFAFIFSNAVQIIIMICDYFNYFILGFLAN